MSSLFRLVSNAEAIVMITFALIIIGTVNIFSASFVYAGQTLNDSYFYLKKHLLSFFIGFTAMVILARVNYRNIRRLIPLAVIGGIILLAAVPYIGLVENGARRWLQLGGMTFQPSEAVKVVVLLMTASYLGPLVERGKNASLLSFPIFYTGLAFLLVYIQPDFGTALIIAAICFSLYLIVGLPRGQMLVLAGLCSVGFVLATFRAAYRAERIYAWLNPWEYQQTIGYQTVQSLLAVGSGGFFGNGLGMGASKFYYLPEAHTDFAFAVLCQEMGFAGAFAVLVLFGLFACFAAKIACQATDGFAKLLAIGITLLIMGQAIVNMAMVTGLLPVVGVPMPFISFGGTSLMINLAAVGLLVSIGRRKAAAGTAEPADKQAKREKLRLIRNSGKK